MILTPRLWICAEAESQNSRAKHGVRVAVEPKTYRSLNSAVCFAARRLLDELMCSFGRSLDDFYRPGPLQNQPRYIGKTVPYGLTEVTGADSCAWGLPRLVWV
jgi:hypothetical protein